MSELAEVVKGLRKQGIVGPDEEANLLVLDRAGELTDDTLAKFVQKRYGMSTGQKAAVGTARTAAQIAGLPGDLARFAATNEQMPSILRPVVENIPGSQQIISGMERATGANLAEPPQPGFIDRATAEVAGGIIGGLPSLGRAAARGIPALGRELAANVGGSVAFTGGAMAGENMTGNQLGGVAGGMGATGALMGGKGVVRYLGTGGLMPWSEKRRLLRENLVKQDKLFGEGITVGLAAPESPLAKVQGVLENTGFASQELHNAALKANQTTYTRLREILGVKDPDAQRLTMEQAAGQALLGGVNRRIEAVRKRGDEMYEQARTLIGDTSRVIPIGRTRGALESSLDPANLTADELTMINAFKNGQLDDSDAAKRILTELEQATGIRIRQRSPYTEWEVGPFQTVTQGQGNTYRALDELRQKIGSRLNSDAALSDALTGLYRKIYGAITADLRDGAKILGGPDAATAVATANAYWKAEKNLSKVVVDKIKNREPEMEKVFRAVMAPDLKQTSRMRALWRYMEPEERVVAARAWIAQMGKVAGDKDAPIAWSIDKFVENWQRADASGRKLILSGVTPQFSRDFEQAMETLTKASRLGTMSTNPTRGGGRGMAGAIAFGTLIGLSDVGARMTMGDPDVLRSGVTGLFATGAAIGGSYVSARLLSSPVFIHWLAQAGNSRNYGVHIGRLAALAAKSDDPLFINDVDTFISATGAMTEEASQNIRRDNPRALRAAP